MRFFLFTISFEGRGKLRPPGIYGTYVFSSLTLTTLPKVPSPKVAKILSEAKIYKKALIYETFCEALLLRMSNSHLCVSFSMISPNLYDRWPSSSSPMGQTAWIQKQRKMLPHTLQLIVFTIAHWMMLDHIPYRASMVITFLNGSASNPGLLHLGLWRQTHC